MTSGGHRHDADEIAREWAEYWRAHGGRIPDWDYMSQLVLERLVAAAGRMTGRDVLEVGSGTGRISLELARLGARASCVDISPDAARSTRERFAGARLPSRVAEATMFALPFADASFDIVWNAGVLEHFDADARVAALREMVRVTRPGGTVVTLNPYRYSLLYRAGKTLAERTGRWPYGHEEPIDTLVPAGRAVGCRVEPELTAGFFIVLIEALRALPALAPVLAAARSAFVRLHRGPAGAAVRTIDLAIGRLIGGYLLVTVLRRER